MSTVPGPVDASPEDVWVAVDEAAAVATAQRRAAGLALPVGLDADRVGEVEIIASELASNIVKHGGGGDLVLRAVPGGVQLIAIDAGPGTRDLEALIADGVSTAGTLGVGLSAVRRLAARLDLWSAPARGAVVVADVVTPPAADSAPRLGSLVRTIRGESVCGDSVASRRTPSGWVVAVADGLGHGPLAAEPSRRATAVLAESGSESPSELVTRMHSVVTSSTPSRSTTGASS